MQLPGKKSFELGPASINVNRVVIRDPNKGVGKINSKGDIHYKNAVNGVNTAERKSK